MPSVLLTAAGLGVGREWEWRCAGDCTAPTQAGLLHVLCGECAGVEPSAREEGREMLRDGLRQAMRAVTHKRTARKPHALTEGREQVVRWLAAAQRALAKGTKRATLDEQRALRACLAGGLPHATGSDTRRVKYVERATAGGRNPPYATRRGQTTNPVAGNG